MTNCKLCRVAQKDAHHLKRLGGVALGKRLSLLHAQLKENA